MSQAHSVSDRRRYGLARVCRVWAWARSTVYAGQGRESRAPVAAGKRGPKTSWTDARLAELIREVLGASPFVGEGYRKVWARLRLQGIRTSKGRVLRLMRLAGLLAPTRQGHPHGPRAHDRHIITDRPDVMWGIDATGCLTDEGRPPFLSRSTTAPTSASGSMRPAAKHALRRSSRCARACASTMAPTAKTSPPG